MISEKNRLTEAGRSFIGTYLTSMFRIDFDSEAVDRLLADDPSLESLVVSYGVTSETSSRILADAVCNRFIGRPWQLTPDDEEEIRPQVRAAAEAQGFRPTGDNHAEIMAKRAKEGREADASERDFFNGGDEGRTLDPFDRHPADDYPAGLLRGPIGISIALSIVLQATEHRLCAIQDAAEMQIESHATRGDEVAAEIVAQGGDNPEVIADYYNGLMIATREAVNLIRQAMQTHYEDYRQLGDAMSEHVTRKLNNAPMH